MSSLHDLIDSLTRRPGPVLTSYSHERVELGGAVAARWLAKIANLLGEELSVDLFSGAEMPPGRILLNLDYWQRVVWEISALGMGWTVLPAAPSPAAPSSVDCLGPADVLVTHKDGPQAREALAHGAHVLLQPRDFLAFGWGQTLPAGALDALAELMAQPDALITRIPDPAPALNDAVSKSLEGNAALAHATIGSGARVGLIADSRQVGAQVLDQWLAGHSVVLIDPTLYNDGQAEQILVDERADGGWVVYRW